MHNRQKCTKKGQQDLQVQVRNNSSPSTRIEGHAIANMQNDVIEDKKIFRNQSQFTTESLCRKMKLTQELNMKNADRDNSSC